MIVKEPIPVLQSLLTIIIEDWLFTLIKQKRNKTAVDRLFFVDVLLFCICCVFFRNFCLSYRVYRSYDDRASVNFSSYFN